MAILFLFYKLLLEKENMHVFKRFYLLCSLVISLLIPTLVFTKYVEIPPITNTTIILEPNQDIPISNDFPITDLDVINWKGILWTLYFIGFAVFGFRFTKHLFRIIHRIQKNPKRMVNFITMVLLKEKMPPHTFFNYIFLNKKAWEERAIPNEVLIHEEAHAKQYHSLDVLFIELLQVILWFNPLVYLFKKNIKLNHEFLADNTVLKQNVATQTYQNALLSYLSEESKQKYQSIGMANAINYSSIKKRFTVMKKQKSQKVILARTLLLLPLLALLTSGFCGTKTIYTNPNQSLINGIWLDKTMEQYAFSIASDGKTQKLYVDYTEIPIVSINDQYYAKFPYTMSELSLNNEQTILKFRGKEYVKFDKSSRKNYEGYWENTDGSIQLNIENYSDAFICNLTINGKTNKFYLGGASPKGFLFSYGHEYWSFELKNGELHDSKGNVFRKLGENTIQSSKRNSSSIGLSMEEVLEYEELAQKYENNKTGKNRILFSEIQRMLLLLNKMSDEQKQNVKVVFEPLPKNSQNSASREQIKQYNLLAKKYNTMDREHMRILMKDVERLEYIYGLMSAKQKADAEPFPDFPDPPPPPKAPRTADIIEVASPSPPNTSKDKVIEVPAPSSSPKVLKGEVSDIPPPPPPPAPKSPVEHIREVAKKGAQFYFEGKKNNCR